MNIFRDSLLTFTYKELQNVFKIILVIKTLIQGDL